MNLVSMELNHLGKFIDAIDKAGVGPNPPFTVVDKYCRGGGFDHELDRLRNNNLFLDDISSYNSLDDKFDMCVYPPGNICGENAFESEIIAVDISAVEKLVVSNVFGGSLQTLNEFISFTITVLDKLRSMFYWMAKQKYPAVSYQVTSWFQRVYMLFLDTVISKLGANCDLQAGWELPLEVDICNKLDPELISSLSDCSDFSNDDDCAVNQSKKIVALHGYADIVVRDKERAVLQPLDHVKCLIQLKRPFGLLYRRAFEWQLDQLQCQLLGLRQASDDECVSCLLTDMFAIVCAWQDVGRANAPAKQVIMRPISNSREYLLILALVLSDKDLLRQCASHIQSPGNNGASSLGKRSVETTTDMKEQKVKRRRRGGTYDRQVRQFSRKYHEKRQTAEAKASTAQWYHDIHSAAACTQYLTLTEQNLYLHDSLQEKSYSNWARIESDASTLSET
jgi:hypothetical protein